VGSYLGAHLIVLLFSSLYVQWEAEREKGPWGCLNDLIFNMGSLPNNLTCLIDLIFNVGSLPSWLGILGTLYIMIISLHLHVPQVLWLLRIQHVNGNMINTINCREQEEEDTLAHYWLVPYILSLVDKKKKYSCARLGQHCISILDLGI
jgi:hypothetical protein